VTVACGRGKTEEGEEEVDEEGPDCKNRETQGLYCKAQITFPPVLK
jgi:hypothetical protein